MSDLSNDLVINDDNYAQFTSSPVVNGEEKGFGMVAGMWDQPMDYAGIEPFSMPLIPRDEWPERIRQMEQDRSRLSDVRMIGDGGNPIRSTDQGSSNFCWGHSITSGLMLSRAVEAQPHVRLSAFSMCCKIKQFRNQGGWNPEAAQFAFNNGCASVDTWPEKAWDRSLDNSRTWEDAAQYKITEGFWNLALSKYDRNLTFDQLMTCLLARIPCPVDFGWWRHSVLGVDPLEVDANRALTDINRWGIRIWNSWSDSWGTLGMAALVGQKAVPDGATAIKAMGVAA